MSDATVAPTHQVWKPPIVIGVPVHVLGVIIAIAGRPRTDSIGNHHGSIDSVIAGLCIAWVGFLMLLLGMMLFAVDRPSRGVVAPPPKVPRPIPGTPQQPDAVPDDPTPFAVHAGDSAAVADVRRACNFGSSNSAVRRLINEASAARRLTGTDLELAEAILAESLRRPFRPER